MSKFVLALMALGFVQQVNASHTNPGSVLNVRDALVAGTGCPQGGADIRLTGSLLQIRTPELSNRGSAAADLSRKACAVAIPFKLKANERLVVSAGRVNVALRLRKNASAVTNAEVFVDPSSSAKAQASDNGPKNQISLLKIGGVSSACGQDGILRMNLSQILRAKNARSEARVNGAVLRLQVVKCS